MFLISVQAISNSQVLFMQQDVPPFYISTNTYMYSKTLSKYVDKYFLQTWWLALEMLDVHSIVLIEYIPIVDSVSICFLQ